MRRGVEPKYAAQRSLLCLGLAAEQTDDVAGHDSASRAARLDGRARRPSVRRRIVDRMISQRRSGVASAEEMDLPIQHDGGVSSARRGKRACNMGGALSQVPPWLG